MSKKLLIVESPAKAKTIGKYLGGEFVVRSSVGHIRDLPKENSAIKIVEKGEDKWEFIPTYVVSEGKEKVISELKSATKASDEIYLASDPDREGEAIAWHLKEVLEPVAGDKPFKRVTYNEITKSAVLKAVSEPRGIDMPLVDAQQARRILDRLVGYKVSPLLWKSINCANNKTLSAGRVQSVALRLLVERQREIEAFKPVSYFLMGVEAKKHGDSRAFAAKLARLDGEKPDIKEREVADKLLVDLDGSTIEVVDIKKQQKLRHALPPFTTSTLQQAASSVLGLSPGKTMKLAQSLYEQGRITYMRSDSVNVSEQARNAAKEFIVSNYGDAFYPVKPNFFATKAKGGVNAQEAHEAIRPTEVGLTPGAAQLDAQEAKLYDLIWRRFVASQMADARTTVKTISLSAKRPGIAHEYIFTASATDIDFEGFLKVMKLSLKKKAQDGDDGEGDEDSDDVAYLPEVSVGEVLDAVRWLADEKQTKGPSHYSEASLIKALEENGVGRPSTYAATIETLKTREYAKTEKRKLVPLERGILVCDWLVKKMDSLFSVGYTAQMEAELDEVEDKGVSMNDMLSRFYAKFLREIGEAMDPPPDKAKFDTVFSLLANVKEWKPAKKVGKRVYDDQAFVKSVREQVAAGQRPPSARQLQFLVRMAVMYAAQIPDCEAKLKAAGLAVGSSAAERADPALVRYCFDALARMGGTGKNPFLKSLYDQWDRGRELTMKQFSSLARAVGEKAAALPEFADVRSRLAEYVPADPTLVPDDPTVPKLLSLFKNVTKWRPVVKKGKRIYDDKMFIESLTDQFARRHSLTSRQITALRRVTVLYRKSIPDFARVAEELGLDNPDAGKSE